VGGIRSEPDTCRATIERWSLIEQADVADIGRGYELYARAVEFAR